MDTTRDLGGKFTLTINNKTFPIYGGINTVGRNKEAIVNIKSLNISHHHAIFILVDDDLHFISDLKSSNGTFLNGEPLVALQLYRLRDGARIKFADIEGTYSQCSSEDAKFKSPNDSQYTQNCTQSFYRTDTQLMDDSCSINQNDKTVRTENSTYIPTQVQINVATALETSYKKIHKRPAKLVIDSKDIHKMPTPEVKVVDQNSSKLVDNETTNCVNQDCEYKSKSASEIDQSIIDLHEAETQKVTFDEKHEYLKPFEMSTSGSSNFHEMETQLIPPEQKECGITINITENLNESVKRLETSKIELTCNSVWDNSDSCDIKEQIANNVDLKLQRSSVLSNKNESQDSDQVKSLGISRNIIESQHLSDLDFSNTNSDAIRQFKKITSTLESPVHEHYNNEKIQEESSNDSIDFMTMHKVVDIEKKYMKTDSAVSDDPSDRCNMLGNQAEDDVSESHLKENFAQDSVHPVGLSRNIIVSQNSANENVSDTDSDIIRPVKKSILFNLSQETLMDERDNSREILDEDTNDSLDFMTMEKIADIEKNLPKNGIGSNKIKDNAVDSATCINESASVYKATKKHGGVSDPETDIENDTIEKKSTKEVDSETDIENYISEQNVSQEKNSKTHDETLMIKELATGNKHKNRKFIISSDEKNIMMKTYEEKISCYNSKELDKISDTKSDTKKQTKQKVSLSSKQKNEMNLRRKKRNNISVDSDETDSDIETDVTDINIIHSYTMNDGEDDEKQKEGIISRREVKNSSNLNSSVFQGEEKSVDETRIEESMLESSVEPKLDPTNISLEQKECVTARTITFSINESLNDSDIIPCTQDIAPVRSISQSSKFENSEESFKLGLTQLMEDNVDETGDSKKIPDDQNDMAQMYKRDDLHCLEKGDSDNLQDIRKKFVFKKKMSADTSERVNITLDDDDDDDDEMYVAKTQNLCGETVNTTNAKDDHIFLQPTQKLSKSKSSTEKCIPEEEIYTLCTQKMDGNSNKSDTDEIYLQSTQKLTSENINTHSEETNEMSLVQKDNSQCHKESTINNTEMAEYTQKHINEEDDLNDMFATQTMIAKTTPKKSLERELEFMFATQKAMPTEESLDKIQDVIFQTRIDNSKLPEEDSDLEAILATQKYPDSPKILKRHEQTDTNQIIPGRSIESQLEVLFDSQPSENVSRPLNPLANIFSKETQETEPVLSEVNIIETSEASHEESSFVVKNKHCVNETQCSKLKNRITSQNAVEHSFALLEANSTRIRRSARKSNCENVTVSCPKSRKSMMIAPNEKFETVLALESKLSKGKKGRTAIKRQSPTSLELNDETKIGKKEEIIKKRRKRSESSNVSEDETSSNIISTSSRSTRAKRASKFLVNINEHQDDDFELGEISSKKLKSTLEQKKDTSENMLYNKRSTRMNRKLAEEEGNSDINSKDEKVSKSLKIIAEKKTTTSKDGRNKSKYGKETSTKHEEMYSIENKQNLTTSDSSNSTANYNQVDVSALTTKQGCEIAVSTPSKTRKKAAAITPSTRHNVLDYQDSPNRSKRKQKTKVVFTMIQDPKLESVIKLLGGTVVDSVDTCTVLITPSIKRSMKLLSAVGLGKPICSIKWIEDSKKKNQFLDPWEYLLIDKEAERKWEFSLKASLERSLLAKLFEGYTFQLIVKSTLDVLKGAIECCGGKIVTRTPKEIKNFIVVASPEQEDKYKKMLKQQPNLRVIEPEAIFDGVLRQEIRFERHLLK